MIWANYVLYSKRVQFQIMCCTHLSRLLKSGTSIFPLLSWPWKVGIQGSHFIECLSVWFYPIFPYCSFLAELSQRWCCVLFITCCQMAHDCSPTGDGNIDHLIKIVSAGFLQCKIIYIYMCVCVCVYMVINKYFLWRYFETM